MIRVFLSGNVVKEPTFVNTKNGSTVCNFLLAVNPFPQSQTKLSKGEKKLVRYFYVSMWDHLANACSSYLVKGKEVVVVAKDIEARAYLGKNGPSASLHVTADAIEVKGRRADEIEQAEAQSEKREEAARGAEGTYEPVDGFIPVNDPEELPF